jgi:thiamine pyrophosphokinase
VVSESGLSMRQNMVIISGGRLGNMDFFRTKMAKTDNRLLICCDGGARHLKAASMMPDVLMGDMDSLDGEQLANYERLGVKIIKYPANKDFTDTALALDYAMSLQPESIDIWGAQGGRTDHALANLFLLLKARQSGIKTRLMDEYCETFVAGDETFFAKSAGCLVSLIALSPTVEGVTLQGFLYPLAGGTFRMSESRGISNIIQADRASIRVGSGHLLVIRYWQKDVFPEVT